MATDLKVTGRILAVSEATRRRNPALFGQKASSEPSRAVSEPPGGVEMGKSSVPKPRMTRCELRFWAILKERFIIPAIITPQFRIRVSAWDAPVAVHYTADFMVSREGFYGGWTHTLFEVKDSRRKGHSDELTRPKMVREHNPFIASVTLAVYDGKAWKERLIG